jgi:multiple sugar transport system substrate-binding protein
MISRDRFAAGTKIHRKIGMSLQNPVHYGMEKLVLYYWHTSSRRSFHMKKTVVLLLMVLLATMVFAQAQTEKTTGPVVVKYSFWGNPDAIGVEKDIIEQFEIENPDIKIEPVVVGYGDYHAKLFTLIAGGNAPDVMRVDSMYLNDFVQQKALLPLDTLIARDKIDLDAYYAQGIVENQKNGVMYGLPWGTAPYYMVLNLDTFEKAGIPLPPIDWTIDDFVSIMEQFGKIDGVYGFAWTLTSVSGFYPFAWANGSDLLSDDLTTFTLNSPEAAAGIQLTADLYQRGLMPQDVITANFGSIDRWFLNGNAAMLLGSAAVMLSYQKVGANFDVWPMPVSDLTDRTTIVKSNVVGISTGSKNQEAAWRFLQFLRGPEGKGEELYMKAKRIPPTIKGEQYWSWYSDPTKSPKNIREVTEAISERFGRGMQMRSGIYEIEQMILPEMQRVYLGEITAKEALDKLAPAAQAILDR